MNVFDWVMVWTIILGIGYKLGYIARLTSVFVPLMVMVGVSVIGIIVNAINKK